MTATDFINEKFASAEFEATVNDRLADGDPTVPIEPLRLLANLAASGALTADERDAGEILHRLAIAGRSPLQGPATVNWRDKDGKWSIVSKPRLALRQMMDQAMQSIRTPKRERAVRMALVTERPRANLDATHQLTAGVGDVARAWWGVKAKATALSGNVKVARVSLGEHDATTERLVAANDNFETVDGVRRLFDTAFDVMAKRKQLDEDPEVNELLFTAGRLYQQDHHAAGFEPLGAIDYSRPMVDGSGGQAVSERSSIAKDRFRAARRAIGSRYGAVVDAVVLDGKTLLEAGRAHCGYTGKDTATASAKERLNAGLRILAQLYGLTRLAA
ncbi:hypothetical protein GHK03_35775 [Sinorhizobium medicae]|uniref:DUF6456 domain-containing protein n=1 Tax=Sinorhizobium medicae TaxID=110321 RepID=UPI0012962C8F|nr:DUF6456 domain-containing protein [Sinorhizobium medicae]MQY01331.1 hypothetical protein [Sinorhizobium medicae]